ncbi:MAG: carboxypeptidase regulatory-like domain-containing protein, partial [Verrucomicrobiota bacterium]
TVVAGETVRDTVVYVSKGALVEVTVAITNDAKPLANVPVSSSQSTAYTGANGVALLRVPTGKSWFSARNNWRSQNTEVEVQAGLTNHVRIELPTPPSISGTVRDASGAPAPRSLVSFHPGQYPDAPDYSEVTTDKNGRYEVTLKLSREDMGWDGPISETNAIMARDPERNLVAIQEFKELPTNLDLVLQPGITLSGSVKDTQGAPVTNATVDLRFLLGRMLPPWTPQPAKVNAQGLFSFTAMPQGRQYFIQQVTAKGYGAAYSEVKAEDTKTNHYEFPAFVLKRADRKLSGQVLGQDGKPFAGAEVNFSGVGQPRRQIWSSASVKSDTNGRFAFDAVCEGQVTVSVNYNNTRGNISAQGGDTNVVVRLGVNLVNYGQNQAPPRNIAGTVRDPSGAPAPGVTMSLNPVQGRTIDTQTDSDGRYEFTWQPRRSGEPATWLLARDVKNGYAAIHPVDEQTTNLDLTMQVGLTLSTRVQDSGGRQLTNATAITTVWAEPNRGFSLNPQPMIRDDDGLFRLNALPQGLHYALRVESPGYSFARLDAEAGDTKTIFLALPPSILAATNHQVAGVVLGLDGKPAPFVAMQLLARDQGVQQSQTDSDGRFVFEGLGLGPVVVYAGGRSGAASAWGGDTNLVIRMQPPGSAANPASRNIASAQVTNSGTVLDPSGAPAPGVFLSVGPSFGTNNKIQSDSAGNYALHWTTVPIRGIVNASLLARDPEHNWAAFAALDATTKNLDLRLQPGFTLSGAVRDADGKPLAGAAVLIYLRLPGPGSASQSLPPTNTDAQGVFSLGALPRGAACTVDVAAAGYGSNTTTAPSSKTQTSQLKLPPIALKLANQIVAGRVVGEDGKPCWGAQVTVRGEGQPAPKPGRTDSNGNFVLQDVCQGPVEVRAVLSAGMNQGRTLVGVLQANGGETNLIVRLGMQNGVPAVFPVDQGPGPVNRPSAPSASQP